MKYFALAFFLAVSTASLQGTWNNNIAKTLSLIKSTPEQKSLLATKLTSLISLSQTLPHPQQSTFIAYANALLEKSIITNDASLVLKALDESISIAQLLVSQNSLPARAAPLNNEYIQKQASQLDGIAYFILGIAVIASGVTLATGYFSNAHAAKKNAKDGGKAFRKAMNQASRIEDNLETLQKLLPQTEDEEGS